MHTPVFLALAEAARRNQPVALAIICGTKGSSPQKVGAKAVFYPEGRIVGTLGGGCLEAEIQQRAIQSLGRNEPGRFELVLDHDFGWDDGLVCGGAVDGVILPNAQKAGESFWAGLAARAIRMAWGVAADFSVRLCESDLGAGSWLYWETVSPPCALWIAGAGHIAQAVAPLALQLDFAVTVFDDRPALASYQNFPRETVLYADAWEKLLRTPLPASPAFALIVTRGHRHDALVLKDWIHRPFLFIAMIGSARKARTIFDHFAAEGLASGEELSRVACPAGLPIRSKSVMEIAVSIVAQLIEKRAELVLENPEAAGLEQPKKT